MFIAHFMQLRRDRGGHFRGHVVLRWNAFDVLRPGSFAYFRVLAGQVGAPEAVTAASDV